jgi:hypothetical protein
MGGVGDQEAGQRQGEPVMPDQGEQQGGPEAELEGAGVMHEVGVAGEAGGVGEPAGHQQRRHAGGGHEEPGEQGHGQDKAAAWVRRPRG